MVVIWAYEVVYSENPGRKLTVPKGSINQYEIGCVLNGLKILLL